MVKTKTMGVPTARDGGNVSLVIFIQIILSWVLVDCFGLDVPREVVGAFGGLFGYFAARKLRY